MKKETKRELYQWLAIIVIGAGLYLSGYHTEVIGKIQSIILQSGIMKASYTENPIPVTSEFELISIDGEILNSTSLKNKVVFINIWATWCPPCVAEMPDLNRLVRDFKDPDLVYLFIANEQDVKKVKEFISRKNFTMPVYFLNSALPAELQSNTIPSTFVINKQNKIVIKRKGMAKYNTRTFKNKLKTLLEES